MLLPNLRRDNQQALLSTAVFFLWGLIRVVFHEPYRDEAGLLSNAIFNPSGADLLASIKHAGHPYLFPGLVWVLARLNDSFLFLQLTCLTLSTITAWLVFKHSPFSKPERQLLCFGYFISFEYGIFVRPYVLVPLLGFLFCIVRRTAPDRYLLQSLLLATLANTTIYGAMLSVTFTLTTLVPDLFLHPHFSKRAIACGCILGFGLGAAILQTLPPTSTGYLNGYFLRWELGRVLGVLSKPFDAFVPIPHCRLSFWNSNFLDGRPLVECLMSVLVVVPSVLFLLKPGGPRAVGAFLLYLFAAVSFSYLKFPGVLRHSGHYFIVFIMALWIWMPTGALRSPARNFLLSALLVLELAAAFFASIMDLRYPFSSALEAAAIVEVHEGRTGECLIAGDPAPAASTVAWALRRTLYYPEPDRFGVYTLWDRQYGSLPEQELRQRVERKRQGRCAVLVMNRKLSNDNHFHLIGATRPAIMADEQYYLYSLDGPQEAMPVSTINHSRQQSVSRFAPPTR